MTLRRAAVLIYISYISMSLLSGCAYIQGRKDDQQAAMTNAATNKKTSEQVIQPEKPSQPMSNTSPNPSETGSKILAPIIQ